MKMFEPLRIGDLELPNRLVMSPLTRCRAPERLPNAMMAEYYRQRSGAGLIISEGTAVSPMGVGYPDTPGIWSEAQCEAWKPVTDAIHQAGGRIVMQLWHVGRISDPDYLDGRQPVAPSAIAAGGTVSLLRPKRDYAVPRALETDEIHAIVDDYERGAANARKAGFDGVEIHAANGYLPDQFLQSRSNHRSDDYGGSMENRSRFLMEVTDAAISVWGAGRVGVHLAPRGDSHDMGDENPEALFRYVASELGKRRIAFIFTREHYGEAALSPLMKTNFGGCLIANEKLDRDSAESLLQAGDADAVAFGRTFIANPDLVERFRENTDLNHPDPDSFYRGGSVGYIDYPFRKG